MRVIVWPVSQSSVCLLPCSPSLVHKVPAGHGRSFDRRRLSRRATRDPGHAAHIYKCRHVAHFVGYICTIGPLVTRPIVPALAFWNMPTKVAVELNATTL